ncbi:hypothetical protein P4114_31825 [Pseudomonas aeruginosa]|nr:hypothetical protein [Pseudomonas aeruginosa]
MRGCLSPEPGRLSAAPGLQVAPRDPWRPSRPSRVWVLNGPDTLLKLLKLRDQMGDTPDGRREFFILGRVRMRMGFHWRLACWKKRAAGE